MVNAVQGDGKMLKDHIRMRNRRWVRGDIDRKSIFCHQVCASVDNPIMKPRCVLGFFSRVCIWYRTSNKGCDNVFFPPIVHLLLIVGIAQKKDLSTPIYISLLIFFH